MKHFFVNLKEVYPFLKTAQEPVLECFIAETFVTAPETRKVDSVLIIPGGAYSHICLDREGEAVAYKYLSEGFNAFVLKYSLRPEHYPAQVSEAAAAVDYIRAHNGEWKSNKVFVNGFSAGGHIAAGLGVFWNEPEVKQQFRSIRPDGLVLGYPVITSDTSFSHRESIENASGTTDINAEIYKKMSLENQVNENTPPTYIWHTAEDNGVPVKNSLVFASALAENKVPFEMHVFPYGGHGLATGSSVSGNFKENHYVYPWLNEAIKFLRSL